MTSFSLAFVLVTVQTGSVPRVGRPRDENNVPSAPAFHGGFKSHGLFVVAPLALARQHGGRSEAAISATLLIVD
jgi:hypothetical protein